MATTKQADHAVKDHKKKRLASSTRKMIAYMLIVCLLGAGGGVYTGLAAEGIAPALISILKPNTITLSTPNLDNIEGLDPGMLATPDIQQSDDKGATQYLIAGKPYTMKQGLINVLFMGIDTAEFRSINENGYQSDVLVLAVIDTINGGIRLVNIPRDTQAIINLFDRNGKVSRQKVTKINAAFSQGGGPHAELSYKNACDAVSTLFNGISVQYYVGINMDSVGPLNDCIGGVRLEVDVNIPDAGLYKGRTYTLTAKQALAYVRERKLPGMDGSDVSRVKRQMRYIRQYGSQVMDMGLLNLITNVLPSVNKYIDTNLSVSNMVTIANSIKDVDFQTVPIQLLAGDYQGEYWKPNATALQELFVELFFDPVES